MCPSRCSPALGAATSPRPSPPPAWSPPPTSPHTSHPGADAALGAAARPAPRRRPEVVAARVAILVQACEATAGLVRGEDCPCPPPAASAPDGETVLVDLAGVRSAPARAAVPARRMPARSSRACDERLRRPAPPRRAARAPQRVGPRVRRRARRGRVPGGRHDEPRRRRRARAARRRGGDRGGDDRPRAPPHPPPVPIAMDIENGFSPDPAEVAAYVDRLGPVAGVNLEDQLADPAHFAAGARRGHRATDVFINARIDTYWLGDGGGRRDPRARRALHPRRRRRDLRPRRQGRGRDRRAWPRRSPSRSTCSSSRA